MSQNSINVTDINGTNGFIVSGIDSDDRLGSSLSNAGDLNGDGFDDLLIGASGVGANEDIDSGNPYPYDYVFGNSGAGYVIFGGSEIENADIDIANLDGDDGFSVQNFNTEGGLGRSVSSAGDVNGDGFDDIILGAPYRDQTSFYGYSRYYSFTGRSYIIFGNPNGLAPELDINNLNSNQGLEIIGDLQDGTIGSSRSVSSAGDLNGDGFDDFIIDSQAGNSATNPNTPASYVVFGGSNLQTEEAIVLTELDGEAGFVVRGGDRLINYNSSTTVSSAGDLNGDGFDDLIIGGSRSGTNFGRDYAFEDNSYFYYSDRQGRSYVIFGNDNIGSSGEVDLSNLNRSNGFTIEGIDRGDRSGFSVSNAGDVNGDGIDDLLIGAPYVDSNGVTDTGSAYVVFGGANTVTSGELQLSNLNGSNGFAIAGLTEDDRLGTVVSSAGDVNGDGFDDLIIGTERQNFRVDNVPQSAYVIFGGANVGSSGDFDLANLNGKAGLSIEGLSNEITVSKAGDLNNDEFADLVIGAPETGSGRVYTIFGSSDLVGDFAGDDNDNNNATSGNDSLRGTVIADFINALAGDDTVRGFAGRDIIDGGAGNDLLFGNNGTDTLRGGAGDDTLQGQANSDFLEGGAGNDLLIGNNGNDFIVGGAGADTIFGNLNNDFIEGGAGNDLIFGNSGNDILYGGRGLDTLWGGAGADDFVITRGTNVTRIKDYLDGTDLFELGFGLSFEDLTFIQNGSNVQIRATNNNEFLAAVENIAASDLDATDFVEGFR